MKLTLIFGIVSFGLLVGCQESTKDEVSKELANQKVVAMMQHNEKAYAAQKATKEHDFQNLATGSFIVIPSEKTGIKEPMANVKTQKEFISQSGFPAVMGGDATLWAETTTWQQADKKYESFVKKHEGHLYLPVFRAAASEMILKDAALLAENDQAGLDKIAFYVAEMVNNNSTNTAIIYYALNKIKNHLSVEKIGKLAQSSYQTNKEQATKESVVELQRFADDLLKREKKLGATQQQLERSAEDVKKGLVEPAEQKLLYLEKLKELIPAAN